MERNGGGVWRLRRWGLLRVGALGVRLSVAGERNWLLVSQHSTQGSSGESLSGCCCCCLFALSRAAWAPQAAH